MKKFFALLAVVCIAAQAHAAQINVQPVFTKYYNPTDFSEIPAGSLVPGQQVGVEVGIFMNVVSLAAGEDSFGTAAFSVVTTGATGGATLVPDVDAGGYGAFPHPQVDSNGAAPGGLVPLFATNADLGVDAQDYVGILVQMATGAFTNAADPRRTVGEAGSSLGSPIQLGSAFFEWNTTGSINLTLNPVKVSAKNTTGTFVQGTASPVVAVSLTAGGTPDVPEPGTLAMAGMGLIGLVLRRRNG